MGGYYSDMDSFSDDYYDGDGVPREESKQVASKDPATVTTTGTAKRKRSGEDTSRKRQRVDGGTRPTILPRAPLIVWKTKDTKRTTPMLSETQPVEVALMKNWRETSKPIGMEAATTSDEATTAETSEEPSTTKTLTNGQQPSVSSRKLDTTNPETNLQPRKRRLGSVSNTTKAPSASTATNEPLSSRITAENGPSLDIGQKVRSDGAKSSAKEPSFSKPTQASQGKTSALAGRKRKQSDPGEGDGEADTTANAKSNGTGKRVRSTALKTDERIAASQANARPTRTSGRAKGK